jgi:hypothetical protein
MSRTFRSPEGTSTFEQRDYEVVVDSTHPRHLLFDPSLRAVSLAVKGVRCNRRLFTLPNGCNGTLKDSHGSHSVSQLLVQPLYFLGYESRPKDAVI